jgi:hypothetical protein
METVEEGTRAESKSNSKKSLFRMLRKDISVHRTHPNEDRLSTGISSSEQSSYYHVEYNDDNDVNPSNIRQSMSRPSLNKKRIAVPPRHQVPILIDSPANTNIHRPKMTPTSDSAVNAIRERSLSHSATLSTYPTRSYPARGAINLDSYLRSDTDSDADTWAEIADASMVVERAIERLETFRSDDGTEDPAKLRYLLSVVSDEDTLGDVEKALNTLKKHASRLGVKETDLLLAVASQSDAGTPRSNTEESDARSYKSLTLGEELLNIFGVFVKPTTHRKRIKRSRRSSRRHKTSSYAYR